MISRSYHNSILLDSSCCNKEMPYAADRKKFVHTTFGKRNSTFVYTAANAQSDVRNDERWSDNDGRKCMFGCIRTRYAAEDAEGENNGV